jgi:hypothetical protein
MELGGGIAADLEDLAAWAGLAASAFPANVGDVDPPVDSSAAFWATWPMRT